MTPGRSWPDDGRAIALAASVAVLPTMGAHPPKDPLPSWNDGPVKRSIVAFVEHVTSPGSPGFLPVSERIATFDNDGTLWCEQPAPVQVYFALDRVRALAPEHPEWQAEEPFASLLRGDYRTALAGGETAIMKVMMATHAGMTTLEFEQIVKDWIATARHPRTGRHFTDMVYQPMLELLAYLRAKDFRTFIVSGGGIEFMRAWAEAVYGIAPDQVVGSSIMTEFDRRDGRPVLVRLPELLFNDDKSAKVVGIHAHIGRRPVMAFGNSNGDKEMLEYTQGGDGDRFGLLVLHDDAAREFAYGPARQLPDVMLGAFRQDLYDQAEQEGWTVVSMQDDWKEVFPAPRSGITAIDILLEPDTTMLRHAEEANARLLEVFPKGFPLDDAHRPHVTMLQLFVRTADLEQVHAAIGKVFARVKPMKLEAFKYYYIPAGELGLSGILVRPTPELLDLQADIIAAVGPFMQKTGPIEAFTAPHGDAAMDAQLIGYVSSFVQKEAGAHFNPHVTTGVAPRAFLDSMLAAPFTPFTFHPSGAAVYQLGPFGTAAKALKAWPLQP
jgi:phosphoserine phosphatase